MPEHEEDLVASQTEGFKVGEKKTIEEYQNLGMCYLRSPAPLPGNPIPLPLPVVVASWHPTSPPPPCLLLQSRQMYIASIPDTPPWKIGDCVSCITLFSPLKPSTRRDSV